MILQALSDYYDRSRAAGTPLPDYGWENRILDFALVLNNAGKLVDVDDLRIQEGKKPVGRSFIAPRAVKRSSGVAANLLWDKIEYVVGYARTAENASAAKVEKAQARASAQLTAFISEIRQKAPGDSNAIQSVLTFLSSEPRLQVQHHQRWPDIEEGSGNISFRIDGERELVFERSDVKSSLQVNELAEEQSLCLITGEMASVARLHPPLKGVRGAQSSGADIVSFNAAAFRSYGNEQGANAPISDQAAFQYTTAVNHLLRRDSQQKLPTGDSTTVWWAAKSDHPLERGLFAVLGDPYEKADNPDKQKLDVLEVYNSPSSGAAVPFSGDKTEFYVLSLSPNAARVSVRSWHRSTADEIGANIYQWFKALEIDAPSFAQTPPSINQLLRSLAAQRKLENLPPNLAGEVLRAVLGGGTLPITLLQAALRRNQAEQTISYERAAVIKAVLLRNKLFQSMEELTVSLDLTNENQGYRLGRLFAAFERLQEAANPGLNKTISDTYFGTAGSTPQSVFNRLFRLRTHHLAKLRREKPGLAVNVEKLIGEIVDGINGETALPKTLSVGEQGQFAIGYYHQRQNFYSSKTTESKTDEKKD